MVEADVLFFDRKPAAEKPWTEKLWVYDLRTNKHFTLKENPLKRSDLDDFVACHNPKNRHERKESERFKSFAYEELIKRDKSSLPNEVPGFPRLTHSFGAPRRKAGVPASAVPRHLLAQR
jgi:hypothetical protein